MSHLKTLRTVPMEKKKVCLATKLRTSFQKNLTVGSLYNRNMVLERGHNVCPVPLAKGAQKKSGLDRVKLGGLSFRLWRRKNGIGIATNS